MAQTSLTRLFFSFRGRIGVKDYWIAYGYGILLYLSAAILALMIKHATGNTDAIRYLFGSENGQSADTSLPQEYMHEMFPSLSRALHGSILVLLMLLPALAVQAKRWHDRNKSAWWILINIVPVIGPIWAFIENGFLDGTEGGNLFGADPLFVPAVEKMEHKL